MKQLLLASCIGQVIQKTGFLFEKPFPDLKVICISTAANVYENPTWLEKDKIPLREMGMNLNEFDIAGKNSQEVTAVLKDADVIYVTGGNTYYLLEQMKKCNFSSALKAVQDKAVYIGSSAGAIVTCPRINFIGDMDDSTKASLKDFEGLGLIDFLIMPHIDDPKYGPKASVLTAELKHDGVKIIGLRDNQALYVQNNYIEIY